MRENSHTAAAAAPFTLDGCAAWLHVPPPGKALNHAVVLCNPLGSACVTIHRNWRQFACMLSHAGFPTLRFDYPGTGDSADPPEAALIAPALASLQSAISWLQAHTGASHISLCGLRFGALVAAEAAAAQPGLVTGLALLAAPPSGRAYLRELDIGARTRNLPSQDGVALEVDGLCLTAPDFITLRGWDLPRAVNAARPAQVLVLQPTWQPARDEALAKAARDSGAALSQGDFPGLRDFMKPAYKSLPPEDSFQDILDWLRPDAWAPMHDIPPPALPALIQLDGGSSEAAFTFGDDSGLFSISCLPAHPVPGIPAALIVNTGAEPHTGHSRFSVLLARRLAELGVSSFRIDVTGLGESSRPALPILPPGTDASDYSEEQLAWLRVFHPEFVDDVSDASTAIRHRGFASHFVIGICSGANLALYAARQDESVAGVVLVNPSLSVRGEIPFEPASKQQLVERNFMRTTMRRWLDTAGLSEKRRNKLRAAWRLGREDAACWVARRTGSPALMHSRTRWFWDLRQRRINMLAITSVGDEAVPDWRMHAARIWPNVGGARPGEPLVIGDSHSFEPIALREELIDAICTHVRQQYLPAHAPALVAAEFDLEDHTTLHHQLCSDRPC